MLKYIVLRFLLASLSIETILQETTIDRRRQKPKEIRNGLDSGGVYGAMLGRIKAQGGEKARLGMAVLMWISHSRRPLQVDEICHAIAAQIGSNGLDSDDIPAISTLLGFCQGLAIIDKGTSTVRLIHSTLQEYLCTHPDLINRAHSTMAEICLTYLSLQHIKDLSAGLSFDPRSTPFLEYSSLYWGAHMREEVSELAKTFAGQLLEEFDSHISAKVLWNSISWEFTIDRTPDRKPFSALHCISYFGIAEIANTLIEMKRWDVNQRDSVGMTPLMWAARYGYEDVVELLLREKHIQPDRQDTNYGRTAFSWAAGNGHEGVVRLFLGPQFANPRSIGRQWGKVRRSAGRLFGRRYVNLDSSSESGRTPLSWAAENGHEGIVRLLLELEAVSFDSSSKSGRTPLSLAAENGHEGVVRLLLGQKDVNPDSSNNDGRTPLSWAAENGYEGVIGLLLELEAVNPDSSSKSGRTPLSLAAGNGHEGIVKLLLHRANVSPNTTDTEFGLTPLSWAAENGYEGVVKLLLEREDVDPHSLSKSSRTPLSLAAGNGHDEIVRLLLEQKDVDPDTPDTVYGQTPLSWAAEGGHEGIVRLLLRRKDVNPDIPDTMYGRTPLSWAAENGHEGIVKLLLERKDIDPNIPDTEYGQTPLSWADENGHEGIVKLLLQREYVSPDSLS